MTPEEQQELLNDRLSNFEEKMMKSVNESLNGAVKRLLTVVQDKVVPDAIEKAIPVSPQVDIQGQINEAMNSFLEQLATEASGELTGGEDSGSGSSEMRRKLAELERINQQIKTDLEEQKKRTDAEVARRTQIEEQNRINGVRQNTLEKIQGQVRAPKQFLTLLEAAGLLKEKDNQYYVSLKDQYDLEKEEPLPTALPTLLAMEEYSHFEDIRPGTGTGAAPVGGGNTSSRRGKYFGGSQQPDVRAVYNAIQNPQELERVINEAEQEIQSRA